jgi:hypothetical protein
VSYKRLTITIVLHQLLTLASYPFILVLYVLTGHLQEGGASVHLFANYIFLDLLLT